VCALFRRFHIFTKYIATRGLVVLYRSPGFIFNLKRRKVVFFPQRVLFWKTQ